MRYFEIICEASDAPLYYQRSAASALRILQTGTFRGVTQEVINGKSCRGISTTRSPRFHALDWGDGSLSPHGNTGIKVFAACFVLDQRMLAQRYRIVPYDFYGSHDTTGRGFTIAARRSESEEFIIADQIPITSVVRKLIVFADVIGDQQIIHDLYDAATTRHIPCTVISKSLTDEPRPKRAWDATTRTEFK